MALIDDLPSNAPQSIKDFAIANPTYNYWLRVTEGTIDSWFLTKVKMTYAGQVVYSNFISNRLLVDYPNTKYFQGTCSSSDTVTYTTPTLSTSVVSGNARLVYTKNFFYPSCRGNYNVLFNPTDYPAYGATYTANDLQRRANGETTWLKLTPDPAPTIVSVESIPSKIVPYGTGINGIGLPDMVYVNMSDGTIRKEAVIWDMGNPNYDSNIAGTYTFIGDVANTLIDVTITVNEEDAPPVVVSIKPNAPEVTGDNILKLVNGMHNGLEYSINGGSYISYDKNTFKAINFNGDYTVNVRVAQVGNNPASDNTTLTFTLGTSYLLSTVQKALYGKISSLGYSVFDYLPDNAVFPYVKIGSDFAYGDMTKTNDRYLVVCQIDVFDKNLGTRQVKENLEKINQTLKTVNLGSDWSIGANNLKTMRTIPDPNPELLHGLLEIELKIIKK